MKKIDYLTGLKGLAALLVVAHHFSIAFFPGVYWDSGMLTHISGDVEAIFRMTPLGCILNGNFAVCLFFIVSGFVLSYSYFKHKNYDKLKKQIFLRYFKLAIPIVLVLIIVYLFVKLGFMYNFEASRITGSTMWLGAFFRTDFSLLQVLKEGLLTVFMQPSGGYLTVLWTIHYEILGSILAYIVSFIVLDNKKRSWIYVLLIIFFAKTYYVLFIFGVILADLYLNRKSIFERLNKPVISFVLIIMVIYLGGYPSGVIPTSGIYFWLTKLPLGMEPYLACHFLAGLVVVLLVLSSKPCQKLLALKPFQKLGNISFSMYLLHVVVICSLSSYLFLNLYKYTNRYLISTGITFIVSLIVILLGSNYLEKLITKITGFFVNKLDNLFPFF